ncbi:MAG: thiolase family protein, partial [Deltaproteobacteria bacterium]|nr:thiolase family protein [Deltaproteobacteria bacterium]
DCDAFALLSHQKAARAWNEGYFEEQCIPVEIPLKKGKSLTFSRDECVRFDATIEALSALRPAFKKDGVLTAGNSSPMNDGAAALVVMEKEKAETMGLEILGKFKAYAAAGVDPRIMGTGPIAATRKLFAKTGMTIKDFDLIELNEAFASQALACIRELDIDEEKLNPNGGAIALGHPTSATGAILVTKMVYEMKRRDLRTGMISFCVGGGQGVSVVLEKE